MRLACTMADDRHAVGASDGGQVLATGDQVDASGRGLRGRSGGRTWPVAAGAARRCASRWPAKIRFGSARLFSSTRVAMLTPCRFERRVRLSPAWTTTTGIGGQGDGGQDRSDSQSGDEPDERADQQGSLQEIVPPGCSCQRLTVPVQGRITTRADARSDRWWVKVPADRPGVLRYRVVESAAGSGAGRGRSPLSGIIVTSRNPCEIPSHTLGGSR